MSKPNELLFYVKRVYGRSLYYPASGAAVAMCKIANRVCLPADLFNELASTAGLRVLLVETPKEKL